MYHGPGRINGTRATSAPWLHIRDCTGKGSMPTWLRVSAHVLALTIALFVIRVIARIPSGYLTNLYGIYAVFTALFYAGIFAFYIKRWKRFYPLALASCLLGWILFVMQPLMGVDALGPMLIALAAYALQGKASNTARAAAASFAFAASGYPVAVLTGMISGTLSVWPTGGIAGFTILLLAGCALSIAGTTLGLKLARRFEE